MTPQSKHSTTLDRRHAVVVNADLVDYSRHLADDPAGTVAMVERYREFVASKIEANGGTLVDFVGDNFLAVFESARAAMAASIAICLEIKSKPEQFRMFFRQGLASGEVMFTSDGRPFGDPVTIAARIQAIASRGGIQVSESVFSELDEPGLRLRPLGPHQLKNVPGSVRVYRLEGVDDDALPIRSDRTAPTVAVLPMVAPSEFDSIGQAIRMDLLTALVKMPGLGVIDVGEAETSDSPASGARYLLEMGLHGSGSRVRAYVQLIELPAIHRVWGERWEADVDDLFELQDRMTADVVQALEVELIVGQPSALYRSLVDQASVQRVYRGWHELAKGTKDGFRAAVTLFEEIDSLEPDLPTGSALASFAYWYGAVSGLSGEPSIDLDRAHHHAERGVLLGDPSGLSHMVRAALLMFAGGDLEAALAEAREAVAARPTCDVAFGVEASIERYRGNWESAVSSARRAIGMSPTIKPWYATTLAGAYYVGGKFQDTVDAAEPVFHEASNLEAALLLAAAQQALGLERRAAATVADIRARHPEARRVDLRRSHPFQDQHQLELWIEHLEAAGMP